MSVSGLGSSGSPWEDIRARVQSFKSGKTSLSKDDLSAIKTKLDAKGGAVAGDIDAVYANFDKVDTSGDGSISFSELANYAPNLPSISNAGAGAAGPPGGGPPSLSQDALTSFRDKVAAAGGDTTGLNKLLSNFSTADANGDGKLSPDEFKAYAQANGIQLPHHAHHGHGARKKRKAGDGPESLLGQPDGDGDGDDDAVASASSTTDPTTATTTATSTSGGTDSSPAGSVTSTNSGSTTAIATTTESAFLRKILAAYGSLSLTTPDQVVGTSLSGVSA